MSKFNEVNHEVIAMFKKFEHELNELGVDYNATLIVNNGDYTPTSFYASSDPYVKHQMLSITTHPNDSVTITECIHRTLDNVPVGASYSPRLWTHQCTVHGFENLKYNLKATALIHGFDNLCNALKDNSNAN